MRCVRGRQVVSGVAAADIGSAAMQHRCGTFLTRATRAKRGEEGVEQVVYGWCAARALSCGPQTTRQSSALSHHRVRAPSTKTHVIPLHVTKRPALPHRHGR